MYALISRHLKIIPGFHYDLLSKQQTTTRYVLKRLAMHLPISVAVHNLLWKTVLSFHLVLHFTFINNGLVVWNEKKSNCIKPLICVGVRFVKYGRVFSSPVHVRCGRPSELRKNRVCGKIYPPIYAIFLWFFCSFHYLFKTWYSFSPQLERCGDQRKVASYL